MESETNPKAATIVHTVKPSQRAASSGAPQTLVDNHLQRKLLDAVGESERLVDVNRRIVGVLRDALAPVMLDHLVRDRSNSLCMPHDDLLLERLPPESAGKLHQWGNESCEAGIPTVHRLSGAYAWTAVTVPVIFRGRAPEVLCAVFQKDSADAHRVTSALQLGASNLTLWGVASEEKKARAEAKKTSALLELLAAIDNSDDLTTAYQILVNDLQEYLGCKRIALGLTRTGKVDCRLVTVSGLSDFDKRSEFTSQIEAALNEAILRDDVTVVPPADGNKDEGSRAHQTLHESSQARTLMTGPLKAGDGVAVGAWVFFEDRPEPRATETLNFMRAGGSVVGSRLAMLRRSQPHPLLRPVAALLRAAGSYKFVMGMLVCMLVVAALAIPMNYKIPCECQLEPVSRRFVAAPYDGTLKETLVEAGQIVHSGQLLARMDPRELRWEISGLQADYASEKKKRDAAAARDEFALAQQSQLEMERLGLKMQLIEHRLENLEIKSPIDGVVIVGDLKKSEGAPLSIGQAMFEIGPLDQMIVEVAIPEREILYIEKGMEVEIRLDAAQDVTVPGTIERISPRSETRESESVYIAEVNLENSDGTLRPGMKGSAKVISDPHPLGWNLLHRAWESLAMMVGV